VQPQSETSQETLRQLIAELRSDILGDVQHLQGPTVSQAEFEALAAKRAALHRAILACHQQLGWQWGTFNSIAATWQYLAGAAIGIPQGLQLRGELSCTNCHYRWGRTRTASTVVIELPIATKAARGVQVLPNGIPCALFDMQVAINEPVGSYFFRKARECCGAPSQQRSVMPVCPLPHCFLLELLKRNSQSPCMSQLTSQMPQPFLAAHPDLPVEIAMGPCLQSCKEVSVVDTLYHVTAFTVGTNSHHWGYPGSLIAQHKS
jgi:hypothetical protein